MYKSESINYSELRKKVAQLFISVTSGNLTVREALLKFPRDYDDKTVIASRHALCHYEADEDIRKRDFLYAQEQDEYLEFIINTLKEGNELPGNIINSYTGFYPEPPIKRSLTDIIKKFKDLF